MVAASLKKSSLLPSCGINAYENMWSPISASGSGAFGARSLKNNLDANLQPLT